MPMPTGTLGHCGSFWYDLLFMPMHAGTLDHRGKLWYGLLHRGTLRHGLSIMNSGLDYRLSGKLNRRHFRTPGELVDAKLVSVEAPGLDFRLQN